MKTITTTVYTFDELSEAAKKVAIEAMRNDYYEYNDFAQWVLDDDYLLNPPYGETMGMELKDNILINNNRGKGKNIYFSCDRNFHLDFLECIDVVDDKLFMQWLGLPDDVIEFTTFRLYNEKCRYPDTKIEFEIDEDIPHDKKIVDKLFEDAVDKFDEYRAGVLRSIESGIDYYFTDEAIIEEINANDYEFTEDGRRA